MKSDEAIRLLVIEDNEDDFKLLLRNLQRQSLKVEAYRVDTLETISNALAEKQWDIVISDNNIPDRRVGLHTSLKLTRASNPNTPFIIVSGTIGEERAVELVKQGANDYVLKDNLSRLSQTITKEISETETKLEKIDAEKRLKESEERYRLLATSVGDMFFALDADLKCTYWNHAAEKMTKMSSSQAIGRYLDEVFPVIAKASTQARLKECLELLEPTTIVVEDEHAIPVRYFQVSIYPSKDIHSVMVKDITKSRTIARQLKFANEELSTFIYRLSHDIRGPLTSIQGLVNIARREDFEPLASDLFSKIDLMTIRLDKVIHSLREVVWIKQEHVELKELSINEIFKNAIDEANLDENFVSYVAENLPLTSKLVTDPKLLQIALSRILTNSAEFVRLDDALKIEISISKNESLYSIRISDNGVGIHPDMHEKVFNMFFRGNVNSKGPGLGLYLAKIAIEKLGGTIVIDSDVDHGATFNILIPSIQDNSSDWSNKHL